MTDTTDAELLERFRTGDDAALEPLFRFLYGVLKDHHAAEDALQETFVQAIRRAESVAPETFRGWLFTVAYRQAVLQRRRARRVPAQAEDAVLLGLVGDLPADDRAI